MRTDDERRCAVGYLCRGFEVVDGRRRAALLTEAAGLCQLCQRWVRRSLRLLPQDWLKLKLTLGEDRRVDKVAQTRRGKPGSRVLINVDGDELMTQIVALADTAAAVVAESLGVQYRARADKVSRASQQQYRLLTRAVDLAANSVDVLVADADGIDVAVQILKLRRRVVSHLGETAQRERKHLPCPSCGATTLVKEVQDRRGRESTDGIETPEVIRCLSCDGGPNRDGTWTEAEYRWLSMMVLSEREKKGQ